MVRVEYVSNNSGGRWWLTDEHWHALAAAGWTVDWYKDKESSIFGKGERWLGALASRARKEFETPGDAVREFERLTGRDTTDDGCNCCGPPHSFSWGDGDKYDYASGSRILRLLYADSPSSLREACERLKVKP